jgi:hypothetical protein
MTFLLFFLEIISRTKEGIFCGCVAILKFYSRNRVTTCLIIFCKLINHTNDVSIRTHGLQNISVFPKYVSCAPDARKVLKILNTKHFYIVHRLFKFIEQM